jgi:hypothetical protein
VFALLAADFKVFAFTKQHVPRLGSDKVFLLTALAPDLEVGASRIDL